MINHIKIQNNIGSVHRFKEYKELLESDSVKGKSRQEIMSIFDSITDSDPYKKLHRIFFDYGIFKYAGQDPSLRLSFGNRDINREMNKFIESLNPENWNICNRIKFFFIYDKPGYSIFEDKEDTGPGIRSLRCDIHIDTPSEEFVKISREVLNKWIELSSFGEDYKTEFFKFWTSKHLFSPRFNDDLSTFESAFIEWMKIASISDIDKAYTEFVNNSKKRKFIDPDLRSIIDKKMEENGITFPGIDGVRISADLIG